jgi:hypothetical protein
MREMDAGLILDAKRLPELRARRGGESAAIGAATMCAAGFMPFAGVNAADGQGYSSERAEIDGMFSALEEFVDGDLSTVKRGARVLATVLFTDIVDSTERAAALGDSAWSQVRDRHDEIARSTVHRCEGAGSCWRFVEAWPGRCPRPGETRTG